MILLKIGFTQILLKDETGIQQVLKTLAKGLEVDYSSYTDPPRVVIQGPIRVAMEVVSDKGWTVHPKNDSRNDPGT